GLRKSASPDRTTAEAPSSISLKSESSTPLSETRSDAPITPGEVRILSPNPNEVIMAPALQVEAQVSLGWRVALEINGTRISDDNVGAHRVDHRNNSESFTFSGLDLR